MGELWFAPKVLCQIYFCPLEINLSWFVTLSLYFRFTLPHKSNYGFLFNQRLLLSPHMTCFLIFMDWHIYQDSPLWRKVIFISCRRFYLLCKFSVKQYRSFLMEIFLMSSLYFRSACQLEVRLLLQQNLLDIFVGWAMILSTSMLERYNLLLQLFIQWSQISNFDELLLLLSFSQYRRLKHGSNQVSFDLLCMFALVLVLFNDDSSYYTENCFCF